MRLAILLLAAACATTPLVTAAPYEPGEQNALVTKAEAIRVGKADPDPKLREIGPLEITDGMGCGTQGRRGTYEEAYRNLKFAAAEVGADYVQIVSMTEPGALQMPERGALPCQDNRFTIRAMAYRLPESAKPRPETTTQM